MAAQLSVELGVGVGYLAPGRDIRIGVNPHETARVANDSRDVGARDLVGPAGCASPLEPLRIDGHCFFLGMAFLEFAGEDEHDRICADDRGQKQEH